MLYPYKLYFVIEDIIGTFGNFWKRGPNFNKMRRIIRADTREETWEKERSCFYRVKTSVLPHRNIHYFEKDVSFVHVIYILSVCFITFMIWMTKMLMTFALIIVTCDMFLQDSFN